MTKCVGFYAVFIYEALVIIEVTSMPGVISSVTSVFTAPTSIFLIVPLRELRALISIAMFLLIVEVG